MKSMILIGENIHIISALVKQACLDKNEEFFKNLISLQDNMEYIDLNVGPAKGDFSGILPWLTELVQKYAPQKGISFDTTNFDELVSGFNSYKSTKAFINSTSADKEKFEKVSDFALEKGCNLIALTLSKETGIPKTSDGRLDLAFSMYERFLEKGFDTDKIFFDPLILPISADQSQAIEALNTIKMIKESFDPPVKTVIGLSNISNGCLRDLRGLINRVFAVLAFGAGLDAAIVDAKDLELVRIIKMLEENSPQSDTDRLYIRLAQMIENFENLDDIDYNRDSKEEMNIIKTVSVLLDNEVYSNCFTQT